MVLVAELVFLLVVVLVGIRWFLRSPIHRARKGSGAHPPQVAGHMGFGMYTPSNPPLLPRGFHDHRSESEDRIDPADTADGPATDPAPG